MSNMLVKKRNQRQQFFYYQPALFCLPSYFDAQQQNNYANGKCSYTLSDYCFTRKLHEVANTKYNYVYWRSAISVKLLRFLLLNF